MADDKALGQNGLLYFWQQIKAKLAGKVDKVDGKGLSTNDYTTAEKNKLNGIEAGATKTIVEDVLTSTSTTNALSANQGKVLDGKIKALSDSMGELGYGDMMKATYDSDNDGVVDNAKKLDGQAASYYAKSDGTNIKTAFTAAASRVNIATGEALNVVLGKIAKWLGDLGTLAFKSSVAKSDLSSDVQASLNKADSALQSFTETDPTVPAWAKAATKPTYTASEVGALPSTTHIPSTVSELSDSGDYAKKSDLTNVYKYSGSVATYADLPTGLGPLTGASPVYNVESDNQNYAWTGTAWDPLGQVFTLDFITNSEIDTILAS